MTGTITSTGTDTMDQAAAKPLRIGMLCPGYPAGAPGDYRGIFIQHLVQALKDRGHAVCVVTSRIRPGDLAYVRVDEREEVHRFPFWSGGRLLIEHSRIPVARMMTYMISALVNGYRALRRFDGDLIHSHFLLPTGLIGVALGMALRRPHIISVHGSDIPMSTQRRPMRALARWTAHRSRLLTITAQHQAESLAAIGIDAGRFARLPMGIHDAFLNRSVAMRKLVAEKKIISTRTLRDGLYNVGQLIRAMKIVAARDPGVTCTIAGEGPDRVRLEALARELGLQNHVKFVGWVDPAGLAELLTRHRIYVSASRSDGASISLFEGMVCGAYPVLSDIAANREWVRDGENGRLFALDDPEALARALLESLEDAPELQRAIDDNRLTAQTTFTWEGIAFRLEGMYREVLSGE